jgi:sugar O-acyltransferase (sialic acid O-acetyltransferase NeuD family)
VGEPLVIAGAGGFGRKVIDIVGRINAAARKPIWNLLGVVDDAPSGINLDRLSARGFSFLGSLDEFFATGEQVQYISGIGSPRIRQLIADRFDAAGHRAATLVDPAAMIGTEVEIGEGSVICAGAALDTNTKYGRHVQAGFNVIVGHDAVVGSFTSISPLSAVSGDCVVGDRVLIGVGAVVMLQRRVGDDAVIGANATVARNVPSGGIVKGLPAE